MPKSADVHLSTSTFYNLFDQTTKLTVPMFQRDYTWGDDNFAKFIEDIEKTMKEEGQEHFIGQMVLGAFPPTRPTAGRLLKNFYHLIDGQQRITTATIFLCALRDEAMENGSSDTAKGIQRYVTTISTPPSDDYDFILTLGYSDKDFFRDFIQFELEDPRRKKEKEYRKMHSEGKIRPSNQAIYEAYLFFRNRIKKSISEFSSVDKINYITRLMNCILRMFFFIEVRLPDIHEGSQIFETMNAWGERLEAIDLVKNLVFMKRYTQGTSPSILENEIIEWNDSMTKLRSIDRSRFLRHYWLSKWKDAPDSVTVENLYKAFCNKAEREAGFAKQLVSDMRDYSDIYLVLHEPGFYSSPAGKSETEAIVFNALTGLDAMNASRAFPLLMSTYRNFPEKFPRMCRFIEIFVFRYSLICNQDAKRLEGKINSIAVEFENADKSDKAANDRLFEAKLLELRKELPPQSLFESNFKNKLTWTSKAAKYVLSRIEGSRGTGETVLSSRSLTLEHIFPKSPSKQSKKEAGKDLDQLLSKTDFLGNLTLVLGKWNQEMSNRPFNYKKEKYYKHSDLKITRQLGRVHSWNSKKIEARNKQFMKECDRIWNPTTI